MVALVLLAGGIGFEGMLVAFQDFEEYRSDSRRSVLLAEIDVAFLEAEIAAKDFASDGSIRSKDTLAEELQSLREICERIPDFFTDKQQLATLNVVIDNLARYETLFSEITDETTTAKRKTTIGKMQALSDRVDHELLLLTNEIIKNQTEPSRRLGRTGSIGRRGFGKSRRN